MEVLELKIRLSQTYDTKLKLKGHELECHSPKYVKSAYPGGGCKVLGEVTGGKVKKAVGSVMLGHQRVDVGTPGGKSGLLWRTAGYLQVGDDEYVAVLKSRVPFLIILLGLLAAIVAVLLLLPKQDDTTDNGGGDTPGTSGGGQIVIDPDHPLPPVDSNQTPLDGDSSEKAEVEEGGGSVSLVFKLDATLDLSTGAITISYENPNSSTHNIILDMYILSGGEEYLIARSGLLEPGYGLTSMELLEDAPALTEGVYTGLFRVHSFDPVTGEQSFVVPEMPGLNITVTNGTNQ